MGVGRRPGRDRPLSAEDAALWDSYARKIAPLRPGPPHARTAAAAPDNPAAPAATTAPVPLTPFRVGQAAGPSAPHHDLAPSPSAARAARKPRLDGHTLGRLRRGRMDPEARLDLHDKTLVQAHAALIQFIHRNHRQGRRLLLVITGKGSDVPAASFGAAERGVLRRQVPAWLAAPSLAALIVDVETAHRRHGGDGALYVWMRRRR